MDTKPNLEHLPAGQRLPALDGLRAIAALFVILFHFGINRLPADLGVSMFFVLSGFLITGLLLKEHQATGAVSVRRFYLRRALRIFPAYYAFLAFSFVVDYFRGHAWTPGLALSGLFAVVNYYNAFNGHPITSISPAWTLGVMAQFYLVWPPLLLLLLRGGRRRAAQGLVLGIVGVVLWRSALYAGFRTGSAYVYNAFDTRFDNLAVGCLLALWAPAPRFKRIASWLGRSPLAPLGTLVLVVLSRLAIGRTYHYTAGFTIDAMLVAVFIVQVLQCYRTGLWSWLDAPIVRYLGAISYPLYLWHQWGLGIGHHVSGGGGVADFGAGVLASVALASASYFVVERPFLSLKRRFEPPAPSGPSAPTHAPLETATS